MSASGLFALRLALAIVCVAHGAHKLFGVWGGPGVGPGGLDNTAAYLAGLGLPASFVLAVLAGVVQLAGGLMIGAGVFARWAALALVGYVLVGLWSAHLEWGLFLNWTNEAGRGHGIEYSIVLLGAFVCIGLCGPGDWSVDGHRASSAESRAAARARVMNKF